MRERSLSAHLLTWILPFTLGVGFLISFANYLIARRTIVQQLEYGVQFSAQAAAAQVKDLWDQYHNDVITISESPLFKDYVMNKEFGLDQEAETYRREIERTLLKFSARSGAFPRIRFLDLAGREICRVQDGVAQKPAVAADPAVLEGLAGLKPARPSVSRMTHPGWHRWPTVVWTMGAVDDAGKLKGVVVFDTSLGPTYEALAHFQIGHSGNVKLAGPRGEALTAGLGQTVAAAPVARTPWSVVLTVDRQEFVGPLWRLTAASLLIALLAALLLGLGLVRELRYLLRPIAALAEAASALAQGALETRVAVSPPREVGMLAQAFNGMAASLKRRTEDLTQRVRELTALHRMNDVVLRQLGREAVARACLDAAVLGLGLKRGALFWVHEDRGEIVGECGSADCPGLSDGLVRRRRVRLDSSDVLAEAARLRTSIIVSGASSDARCRAPFFAEAGLEDFCVGVVSARDKVLVVMVLDYGGVPKEEVRRKTRGLSLFCSAAGLALENARLTEETTASEARYRLAVENSPHAVIGLDQNLRVTLWNRRSEALFGYQPSEAAGRTLSFLFKEADYQRLKRQVETEGSVRQAEVVGLARDGRALELNLSWTGQSAPAGAREWFIVIQDETEKKRLLTRLIQSEKLSAVGRLIAGVAHELNNPLTAVTGFAELLKENAGADSDLEDIGLLHTNALRCRDIIQGLLSFVRQESKKLEKVSINDLVEASVGLLEYRLVRAEGIVLQVELDLARPCVAGDFPRLQQLLVNLLSNAGDAVRGRLGRRIVRVHTRALTDGCEVSVEDNGPGIPRHLRERIFEPFFTTKPSGAGTGLGLWISSQVIAEAGGTLRCEESPEGGARFVARFPSCPAGVEEAQPAQTLPAPCPNARVLVVDDEPEVAQVMAELLARDGLRVSLVLDEPSARRALAGGGWDLVVADVDLGQAKGFDLAESARARGGARPAFLFVTGDVLNPEFRRRAADLGAAMLSKPFLRTEFVRSVRRTLNPDGQVQRSV